VLVLIVLGACGRTESGSAAAKKPEEAPPVAVQLAPIEQRPMPRFLAVTGSLKAERETEVAADAAGKVLETFVERGSVVARGDPLVRLDVRTARLGETQARAQAHLAEQNAAFAQAECTRADTLFKSGIIPQSEYDRRKTACQTGDDSVRAAHAAAELAAKGVNDTLVRAPFAGVVGERFVNVGQYVAPSSRVASLFVIDPLRLELSVPEAEVGAVHRNQPVEFRVAAWPDATFTGTVKFLSPNLRAQSRDLVVEAVVPNKDARLKPGMFAAVKLGVGESNVPVVPAAALRRGEVASSVFEVVDGRATERVVELGEPRDGLVPLLSGVKAGERVVLSPDERLRDGARVTE
jgi:membrane fusion protein (multidrug efflux system)